jgi:hypothetical protein
MAKGMRHCSTRQHGNRTAIALAILIPMLWASPRCSAKQNSDVVNLIDKLEFLNLKK